MLTSGVSDCEWLGVRRAGGMGGVQLIWQAHVLLLRHIHERPALNTLLLGCCLDAHAQLRLGKLQLLPGPGKGVCWGRDAEAECGSQTFSCSHVPQSKRPMARPPVWSPKVDSTCSLAGYPCASHFTSQSLWGSIPISTNNTSGNSALGPGVQQWVRESSAFIMPAFWLMMSLLFSRPWNRGASL